MTVMDKTLKSAVLDEIGQRPLRATELIQRLRKEGYPREIESALSDLLDEDAIEFSSDGLLRPILTTARAS